jgi:hypothetical protein
MWKKMVCFELYIQVSLSSSFVKCEPLAQSLAITQNRHKKTLELLSDFFPFMKLWKQVTLQVANALKQPFEDGSFDLVWSMESGEHMPDKQQVEPLNTSWAESYQSLLPCPMWKHLEKGMIIYYVGESFQFMLKSWCSACNSLWVNLPE